MRKSIWNGKKTGVFSLILALMVSGTVYENKVTKVQAQSFAMDYHKFMDTENQANILKATTAEVKESKIDLEKKETGKLQILATENKQKKAKKKLKHTYKTRCKKTNHLTFRFKYSDHWKITKEESGETSWVEKDVLENDRGVTITYTDYASERGLGTDGRFMYRMEFSKAADSKLLQGYKGADKEKLSDQGPFMVAKIKTTGVLYMDEDSDYKKIDGDCYYAVVPESYSGIHDIVGMAGFYTACSFEGPTLYSFIAEAPKGKFTKSEKKEVIKILSSFQLSN